MRTAFSLSIKTFKCFSEVKREKIAGMMLGRWDNCVWPTSFRQSAPMALGMAWMTLEISVQTIQQNHKMSNLDGRLDASLNRIVKRLGQVMLLNDRQRRWLIVDERGHDVDSFS